MDCWLSRDVNGRHIKGFRDVRIKGIWVGSTYIKQDEVVYGHALELVEDTAPNGRQVIRQRGWAGNVWSNWGNWWKDDVKIDYDHESAGSCEGNWAPDLEACLVCSIMQRCKKASLLKVFE